MHWFHNCCLSILLASAGPTVAVDAASHTDDLTFVNAHVHLNQAETYLGLMDAYEIPRAIVFWGRSSDNDTLVAYAALHPGKLIPFVSISPERRRYRPFWLSNDTSLLAEVEEGLASGRFKGIGEISVAHFPSRGFPEADFDPLGPMMTGIMGLAARYNVPVNVHCEITRLREFSALLDKFPTVNVIWAHGGYTPYFIAKRMIDRTRT